MKTKRTFLTSRRTLPGKRKHSDTCFRESQNIHFMSNAFFLSRKLCNLWYCCEKYGRVRQAIEHGVVQERCNMLPDNCRKCIDTRAFPILLTCT